MKESRKQVREDRDGREHRRQVREDRDVRWEDKHEGRLRHRRKDRNEVILGPNRT